MAGSENKFDPELLRAQWVLGGVGAEELVDQALLALEQGYSGNALQQLAGLVKPALRDLARGPPERVFAELGLATLNKDQAVSVLITRGTPSASPSLSVNS